MLYVSIDLVDECPSFVMLQFCIIVVEKKEDNQQVNTVAVINEPVTTASDVIGWRMLRTHSTRFPFRRGKHVVFVMTVGVGRLLIFAGLIQIAIQRGPPGIPAAPIPTPVATSPPQQQVREQIWNQNTQTAPSQPQQQQQTEWNQDSQPSGGWEDRGPRPDFDDGADWMRWRRPWWMHHHHHHPPPGFWGPPPPPPPPFGPPIWP
ncbi:unnamed protein product [Caenorhabditis bovis]|uniref:Uncharacterized protein n=1 Tax=Caenorhabditis bovis TaxID=2654633 RepID=A0A8S1E8J4_9PELO|nr:unnamed protein product [Caenorhabditis bovis]